MKTKPKRAKIPQKKVSLHLVRPPRLKSEVHRSNVRPLRKSKKKFK